MWGSHKGCDERGFIMGQEIGRSPYRLVVHNSRGQVLGTVVIDKPTGDYRVICNNCAHVVEVPWSIAACVDWIEDHAHRRGAILPMISTERVDDDGTFDPGWPARRRQLHADTSERHVLDAARRGIDQ